MLLSIGLAYTDYVLGLLGVMMIVLSFVTSWLTFAGLWLVTRPEVRLTGSEEFASRRRIARASLALETARVLWLTTIVAGSGPSRPDLTIVEVIITIIQSLAMFPYLSFLALRIPDRCLAAATRKVMWGSITTWGGHAVPVSDLISCDRPW